MIDKFKNEYDFLSNFYPCKIVFDGYIFKNAGAAFQAQKDPSRIEEFTVLDPVQAKHLGKKVNLRKDWDQIKLQVMESVVRAKFNQNKYLAEKLLATGDEELIEVNHWHDHFWGICGGKGKNHLGKILMMIRDEIRS